MGRRKADNQTNGTPLKRAASVPAASSSDALPSASSASVAVGSNSAGTTVADTPWERRRQEIVRVLERCGEERYTLFMKEEDKEKNEGDEGEEDEEEEEEEDVAMMSEDQLKRLMVVIMTKRRIAMNKRYRRIVLGPFKDMWFNTSYGNHIFFKIPPELNRISRMKSLAEQFDALYALTDNLAKFESWMYDNDDEEGLVLLTQQLGLQWARLLAHSDAELGIDPEFTRPATEAMLSNMARAMAMDPCNTVFDWK